MAQIVVTAEIVSLLYLLVILYSVLEGIQHNKKSRRFLECLIVGFLAISIDVGVYFIRCNAELEMLRSVLDLLDFIMIYILEVCYSFYMLSLMNDKRKNVTPVWACTIGTVAGIGILADVVLADMGKLFTFENGAFIAGDWFVYAVIPEGAITVFLIIFIISKSKILGRKDAFISSFFLFVPLAAAVMQCIFTDWVFIYVAIGWLISGIYVLLQSRTSNEAKLREEFLSETTNIDQLTGLKNRRAYDASLKLHEDDLALGVIFTDVNGLKTTNDDKGHAAGDALLRNYVDILKRHFYFDSMYRISGDEFVIIIKDSEAAFEKMVESFKRTVMANAQIASVGYCYRNNGETIYELVAKAEKIMYTDKEAYYIRKGLNRRRT